MLDLITKSETRKRIILLLLYNQEESFYINQISHLTKSSSGNVQRELRKLEELGLVNKERKGNLVYYKIKKDNPFFSEFKGIVDKTIGINKIIKENLKELEEVEFAFIFGSYAKGDFNSESDVDLYIIGKVKEEEVYQAIKKAEKEVYRDISYHIATKEDFQEKLKKSFFHQEILKNFILITGSEDEFKRLIN